MIKLYSAIHVSIHWKIQDRRQIKNIHTTKTKHNPEKANNTEYKRTKLGQETRWAYSTKLPSPDRQTNRHVLTSANQRPYINKHTTYTV